MLLGNMSALCEPRLHKC